MGAVWISVASEGAGLITRASEGADLSTAVTEGAGSGSTFDFRTSTGAVDCAAGGYKIPM
jgi:hypothetical protein